MKINATGSLNAPAVGPGGKRAAAGGFSLKGTDEAALAGAVSRAVGAGGVGSIDALIALQQVEDPLERRRRAVGRAGRVLDILDRVKLALLEDRVDPADLRTLAAVVREERAATDDERLEGVLDQIETRAAVELAKHGLSHKAA